MSAPGNFEAALSLGANLGDRRLTLSRGRGRLETLPHTRVIAASVLYETEPVAAPPPLFLNGVVIIETALQPEELLRQTQAIENDLGRTRSLPNAPRTLDIDLIYYGSLRSETPHLVLPHPRAHLRRFVLAPLAELRPDLILPGQTLPVVALLHALPPTPAVVRTRFGWQEA